MNPVRPAYRLTANSRDVTRAIAERFRSLRLTDEVGNESDMLEIVLTDTDPLNRIQKPPRGAELELWLGYDGKVQRMGLFVFDEFERSGWPGTVTIRARAAVYDQTVLGKTDLQTQKTRSWRASTTLGDMVRTIAQEHQLEAAVAPSLATLALRHYDQTEESDISFLVRILREYDAFVKPADGKLVVAKRGLSQAISGQSLPTVTLDASDVSDFIVNQSERDGPGTVVAYWQNTRGAVRHQVTAGSGDPVRRLRHYFPNEASAEQAVQAELDRRRRQQNRFTGTLPGRPDLMAEGRLMLTGFGVSDVDGEWLLRRVEHVVDEGGYLCRVEAELPTGVEPEWVEEEGEEVE